MFNTIDYIRALSLDYLATEETRIASGSSLSFHTHGEHAFVFVRQETLGIVLQFGEARHTGRAAAGQWFLVPPFCECLVENLSSDRPTGIVIVKFRCTSKRRFAGAGSGAHSLLPAERAGLVKFRCPQVQSWIRDFTDNARMGTAGYYYQLQAHLYGLASAFSLTLQMPREPEAELQDYVEQTRRYMLEQYYEPTDMEEIARSSGVSASRFYQAFRRRTGLSPHKYLTKTRLQAALTLLADSNLPILNVAHTVGYPDEYYFSRLFKKQMGLSPTEYAMLAKRKVACLSPVFRGDLSVLGITPHMNLERGWMEYPEEALRQVAEAGPELIFTPPVTADIYQGLIEIAPVVMLDWKKYSWKKRLLDLAEPLGMSGVAERWLGYFEAKTENARALIRRELGDEPMLVVNVSLSGLYRVYGMQIRKMRDLFYEDLQVIPPESVRQIDVLDVRSVEQLAALDCAHVLFLVDVGVTEELCAELEHTWRSLNRQRSRQRCLFIRAPHPLLNNAAVHDSMVDQTMDYMSAVGSELTGVPGFPLDPHPSLRQR
ncbi:helix-turn-helix domain-containing protein [Paenibacillus puerhi]|uniref:helix-turn-helix domain-containing protein n=1 Tax=Paenibacillus puerhi TaxID=2692622 RepID=UPI00135C021E|nr:AraC family transcriptional regulator [Paenibacillus puerhi]